MLSGLVRTALGLEPTVGMSGLPRLPDVMHGAVKAPCVFLRVLWWMSGVGGVWGEEVRRGKECEYRKGGGLRGKREIEMEYIQSQHISTAFHLRYAHLPRGEV